MDAQRVGGTATDEMRAELRALRALLEEQGATIAAQGATLACQHAEIARLKAAAPVAPSASVGGATGEPKVGRRGMLTRVLGATAAAAVLTVAKDAAPAEAGTNTTVFGPSTGPYGLLASSNSPSPIPPIFGSTDHAVVGNSASIAVLPITSGVAGARYGLGTTGVLGVNVSNGVGVYGVTDSSSIPLTNGGIGVFGTSRGGVGVYGLADVAAGVYGRSAQSVGLYGEASQNAGVYGTSPAYGVWGRTTTGYGVFGQATGRGFGVYGAAASPGWAGFFEGNVYVTGQIYVNGVPVTPDARSDARQAVPRPALVKEVAPPVAPAPPSTEPPKRGDGDRAR